jgi:hypothetical protein
MLVTLSVKMFNARKFDRKVTEKVNHDYAADDNAGRYTKHLFGGTKHSPSHSAVQSAATAARQVHFEQTLPWNDEGWGWRLLPTSNYFEYQKSMREVRQRFEAAADAFCEEYPELREAAKVHLNGMYRPADYPEPSVIRRRFAMISDFLPVPATGDFRLDELPKDQMALVEQSVADRVASATQLAMHDAWRRLYEVLETYQDYLANPKPITRHKMVSNANAILEVLKRLNVTDDQHLESMRVRVAREITSHDARTLKEDDKVKAKTARAVENIMEAMADFYTPEEA